MPTSNSVEKFTKDMERHIKHVLKRNVKGALKDQAAIPENAELGLSEKDKKTCAEAAMLMAATHIAHVMMQKKLAQLSPQGMASIAISGMQQMILQDIPTPPKEELN